MIVDFCSQIMGTVKSLKTGGVGDASLAPVVFNNGLAKLYDSTDGLIIECRLNQLDNEGLLYEGQAIGSNGQTNTAETVITNFKMEMNDVITLEMKGKLYSFVKGKWFDDNPKRGV